MANGGQCSLNSLEERVLNSQGQATVRVEEKKNKWIIKIFTEAAASEGVCNYTR